jgi:hypothetical protein
VRGEGERREAISLPTLLVKLALGSEKGDSKKVLDEIFNPSS